MKKFLNFLAKLFSPKFRIRFTTSAGVRVVVSCDYGNEEQFKKIVCYIFPCIELTETELEKKDGEEKVL